MKINVKTLHLPIIAILAISVVGSSMAYAQVASNTNNVDIQNIQVEPPTIKVGDTFTVNATLVNNSQDPVVFQHGVCEGPFSVTFDNHVAVSQNQIMCPMLAMLEKIEPGGKTTFTSPGSALTYRAISPGTANATATFWYFARNQTDPNSPSIVNKISKSFLFTIYDNNTGTKVPNETGSSPLQFNLKLNETFSQDPFIFKIKLLNVTSDSRCPMHVVCIWAGQVTVSVGITQNNQNLGNFNLSSMKGQDQVMFGKYILRLVDVNPYPSGKKISPSDYVATFEISSTEVLSPLKQYKSGIAPSAVQCKTGLSLIFKAEDGSPACVTPTNAEKLISRGWAKSQQDNGIVVTLGEDQREGPLLVQKILTDSIQGLDFREYPLATNVGIPITLHIGDTASNGCTVELTLVKIGNSTATFLEKKYLNRNCPICLSGSTTIDTPEGKLNVTELKPGMQVWTQDNLGHKQAGTILQVGRTLVPPTHEMVHLVLDDGRELFASPGHPTTDGRLLGDLKAGDILDGTKIKTAELVSYNANYTYDILPSGPTGFYWADGILLKSTLK